MVNKDRRNVKRIKNVKSVRIVLIVILAVLISLAGITKSVTFLAPLTVIPLIILCMNTSIYVSVWIFIATSLLALLSGGVMFSTWTVFSYLVPGFIIGRLFSAALYNVIGVKKEEDEEKEKVVHNEIYYLITFKYFLIAIMLFMAGCVVSFMIFKSVFNTDLITVFKTQVNEFINTNKEALLSPKFGLNSSDLMEFKNTILNLIPVYLFLSSTIMAIISYYITLSIAKKFCGNENMWFSPFDMVFLPGKPVIFTIAVAAILLIIKYMDMGIDTSITLSNFMIIMNILFFIEGLSLIVFIVRNWSKIRGRWDIFIMIFVVIFMGVNGVSLIGFMDNIVNYRNRWEPYINGGKDGR